MADLIINQNNNQNLNQAEFELNQYGYIQDLSDWGEILNIYRKLQHEVKPRKVFLVLDDQGQAEYTSMHATQNDDLYFDTEALFENLSDREVMEVESQIGQFEVNHYAQQLLKIENIRQLSDFKNSLRYDARDFEVLCNINQNPLAVLDSEILIQLADVETEALKFAVLPNGYFSSDLQPFENFAIIQLLANYGFEFLGLGARLLGFIKTEKFDAETALELIQELSIVYHFDEETQKKLIQHIFEHGYLILTYSESLADLEEYYK